MIIIQVTNKALMVSSPKEFFLDTNTLLISTSVKNQTFMAVKFIFYNFNTTKR